MRRCDVKPVQKLVEQGLAEVPVDYVVPDLVNPCLVTETDDIPEINMLQDMQQVVECIQRACKDWGFFRVINHGIRESSCSDMMAAARHFYNIPVAEKMEYFTPSYDDRPVRYSTSFNATSDQVLSWKDVLRLPVDSFPGSTIAWPPEGHFPRDSAPEYFKGIKELASKILDMIGFSLGLESDYLKKVMGSCYLTGGLNFYPPCPDPARVFGIPPHSDPNAITMLLQDSVAGLQVLNKGKWVAVKPTSSYSLIVNLGDQIEILSNGIYKSVVHRVVADKKQVRISIATFLGPCLDAKIEPAQQLIEENEQKHYCGVIYKDYLNGYIEHGLNPRCCIQRIRHLQ